MAARPTAIRSLQEIPTKGNRNWLIYGDSGCGKTVLAGTAPRALFLTFEVAGTESAKAFGSDAREWYCGEGLAEFNKAVAWLKRGGYRDFDWIIPDSISELEELVWKELLRERKRGESPAIQDYPAVWNRLKKIVDDLNRLPINVLYTAQTMRLPSTDEDGEDTTLLLPLVGSTKRGDLAQKVCGKVTLVGYLDVRKRLSDKKKKGDESEEFRRLWISKTSRMFAKSRHHKGVRFIDDPNIAEMAAEVDSIQASRKPKKKKGRAA